jgi:drug/metabolite transporter (DMT)-like permease
VVVVFALLAALPNEVSATTQHIASTADRTHASGWRLIVSLVRSPLWLFGAAAQVGAFVFQAVALHNGAVSVVQPLLVTELVLVLGLRRVWLRQRITLAAWVGAVLASAGLAVFLVAGEPEVADRFRLATTGSPRSRPPSPRPSCWRPRADADPRPGRRAALYAAAAGITWALEAAFIKATTDVLTQFGLAGMFLRWPVYAMAVGGAVGVLLDQQALHVGPLRVSQPIMVITGPLVSIAPSV